MLEKKQRIKSEFLITTEILVIVIVVSALAHLISRFFDGVFLTKLFTDVAKDINSIDLEWYENGWETLFFIILSSPIFYYRALKRTKNLDRVWLLANTDQLTGLYNRRYLKEVLEREYKLVKRFEQYSSTIFMLDIDNFKKINDTYGHSVGDEVLVQLADILINKTRSYSVSARYGGEEFMQVVTNTRVPGDNGNAGIMIAAEHLLKTISEKPFKVSGGKEIPITVSIGVAFLPCLSCVACSEECKKCSVDSWIASADEALYKSKQDGKNRITFSL